MTQSRRTFLKTSGAAALATTGLAPLAAPAQTKRRFKISLAAYSLHRTIGPQKVPMLDLPSIARNEFDIRAIELVSWMLESTDRDYIREFKNNAEREGVKILLIMVDGAGSIGAPNPRTRDKAVEMHRRWIDIAASMGCRAIRMNWAGARPNTMADPAELQDFIRRSAHHIKLICGYGEGRNIDVIVENHGGPSSHPGALIDLIRAVDHPAFGALPDFGNFPPRVDSNGGPANVDLYDAVDKMMPYAKAVSAKCYDFHPETGLETKLDYERLIEIVVDKHDYHGHIGIEYEGRFMSEQDGIKACKKLLERLRGDSA